MMTYQNVRQKIKAFFALDMAGGIVLALSAILAMIVANSPLYSLYNHWLELPIIVQIGSLKIDHDAVHWINDGLMVIFFFLVGLELKREVLIGELSDVKKVILPALAAVGGMLVPALFYAGFNQHDATLLKGWAIPAATDIAFALGVLMLLGKRVPLALKVFLASIAIFDDIGAILVIALFYSHGLSWTALGIVAVTLLVLYLMNRMNVTRTTAYVMVGLIMWVAMLKSGIHATLAGVLLAMFIPLTNDNDPNHSPLETLEHDLHETVTFVVLPIFAFANAGIHLSGSGVGQLFHSVPLGIALGLVLGKPIGVMVFSWLGVKLGLASLPENVCWKQVLGVALLCGIGFTMSLFIGGLAFGGIEDKAFDERLGIVMGSVIAGVLGYVWLNKVLPKVENNEFEASKDHTYIP
nr:Na+/H+ antiporter NhaA [uncultured Moraxella sp.]